MCIKLPAAHVPSPAPRHQSMLTAGWMSEQGGWTGWVGAVKHRDASFLLGSGTASSL